MVRSIEGKRLEYYEAILQLRDITQEIFDYVVEQVGQAGIHIAKTVESKQGIDLYLADSDFTKGLSKKLQKKFGGRILITATLFTKKDGKDIYRTTVLFRGVPFAKEASVTYEDEPYFIKSMGKEIILQHALSGKKIRVKYSDKNRIKAKP
ncbi:TPA: hypothetical protein HA242_03940 [Candidatus Woesearchaeota archaeon]|nr:hypothetical protein [Candidatus Woesearchaeota archaeon]HIH12848.1 hypothetical protein [Candidatus Woesearchaeota archaeon]